MLSHRLCWLRPAAAGQAYRAGQRLGWGGEGLEGSEEELTV